MILVFIISMLTSVGLIGNIIYENWIVSAQGTMKKLAGAYDV